MATLLDEILATPTPKRFSLASKWGAPHTPTCNCVYCKRSGYYGSGSHKYWRQRRAERLCGPQKTDSSYNRGISGTIGNLVPVVRIGGKERAALLKRWQRKLQRTTSPIAKQRYRKYILVILKKGRPSWHQSEKDLQFLLMKKTNIPGDNSAYASMNIKNYNLQHIDKFIRWLKQQIARNMQQGLTNISPLQQQLILDMRGQRATGNQLYNLAQRIARETGLPQQNVRVVTW